MIKICKTETNIHLHKKLISYQFGIRLTGVCRTKVEDLKNFVNVMYSLYT